MSITLRIITCSAEWVSKCGGGHVARCRWKSMKQMTWRDHDGAHAEKKGVWRNGSLLVLQLTRGGSMAHSPLERVTCTFLLPFHDNQTVGDDHLRLLRLFPFIF
ncbi:hypothetical protein CRYUN_Cryun09bG0151600 [Craigia yunnanensis]